MPVTDRLFVQEQDSGRTACGTHDHIALLTERNGCAAGCCTGLLYYWQTDYYQGGVHEDQEGFFVLEGTGMARVGEEEFPLRPGTSFLAPAGAPHYIKRDKNCPYIKLFYFHASVCGT